MFIRTAKVTDAQELVAIYRPYVQQNTTSFEYEVPSVAEFERRIKQTLIAYPYLVVEEDGRILGYAYAHPYGERAAYQWAAEVSVYVSQAAQKKGVGKALYLAIEELLKKQHVVTVTACVTGKNQNSIAFHQHMGYAIVADFQKIGFKDGQWLDTYWLQKRLSEDDKPQPFLPFSELSQ